MVALVEGDDGVLTLHELQEVTPSPVPEQRPGAPAATEPLIEVVDETGATRGFRTVASRFEDGVTFLVAAGSTEMWKFLNLTQDTHSVHLHLVQFQITRRDVYDTSGFSPSTGGTTAPIAFQRPGHIDDNEAGRKDTIRVNPHEQISIAARFDGGTGRFVYHCHLLEHEDNDMMRPYLVLPPDVLALMSGTGIGGHSGMSGTSGAAGMSGMRGVASMRGISGAAGRRGMSGGRPAAGSGG